MCGAAYFIRKLRDLRPHSLKHPDTPENFTLLQLEEDEVEIFQ
jgi:hypothetical protein